jgi:hypothetical protein
METIATSRRSHGRDMWRVAQLKHVGAILNGAENGPAQSLAMSLSSIEFGLQAKLVRRMRHLLKLQNDVASADKAFMASRGDDAGRRSCDCWSLNFANPQVLAEIDLVFITFERTEEDVPQQKRKQLLTAYLGTPPNHP